ncbi:alanine racemase [Streptomyces sp. NBC_01803]|uniref:alanine racemase n=1 Tax=Streptomyces sp. NBC_01803 TaxID=2975946 RepID=UPI002DDC1498|nr:alanine racemase [Streptomyces sp. NBC_01803]WSA47422.1 alanine racemase [Streptomyces sp. NBC_01803]
MKHLEQALCGLSERIDTPSPVVVLDALHANISGMQQFAAAHDMALRPHVKTHKCVEIGRLQLEAGAVGITAGNIGEAEVFASAGFRDIFIAYPVWPAGTKPGRIRHLAETVRLRLGIDSREAVARLGETMRSSPGRLEVVVEVDCGAKRSGVAPEKAGELAAFAATCGLRPVGVYTYPGHGGSGGVDVRAAAARDQSEALRHAVTSFDQAGIEARVVSAGSTPTAAFSTGTPINEIRPGEYVFGDMDNLRLGACQPEQIALFLTATVVSDSVPKQVILDAGTKALGREGSPAKGYGTALGVEGGHLTKLNEYHGFLTLSDEGDHPALGTVLAVVPNHVCPVVNNFDELIVTNAAGDPVARWPVAARGGLS